MQTQAYFENIQEHILDELDKSIHTIQVAVAWMTDYKILRNYVQKLLREKKLNCCWLMTVSITKWHILIIWNWNNLGE